MDDARCLDCKTPMLETWTCVGCDRVVTVDYERGVADERGRILALLSNLRDEYRADDLSTTALREAIVQLSAAPCLSAPSGQP